MILVRCLVIAMVFFGLFFGSAATVYADEGEDHEELGEEDENEDELKSPAIEVNEFPTIALPIVAIIGLALLVVHRKD